MIRSRLKLLLVCSLLFLSCSNPTPTDVSSGEVEANSVSSEASNEEAENVKEQKIDTKGYWTGMFIAKEYKEETDYTWENKITISIDKIEGEEVMGHSIVAGNFRPFKGSMVLKENGYHFEVEEPGDDTYDGVFTFTIDVDSLLYGEWTSYDENLKVTVRRYQLEPKKFVYNPKNNIDELYEYIDLGKHREVVTYYEDEVYYDDEFTTVTGDAYEYNASVDLLKEEDVANMKKGDLQIIRNTIYARHGYSFKNKIYRTIFDNGGLEWYMPVSINVENELTAVEKKNIALIKRYEDYAEEYYDTFGR